MKTELKISITAFTLLLWVKVPFLQKKNAGISRIKRTLALKVYFVKLHMCVSLRTKFQASTIILISFRHGGVILPPPQNEPLKSPPRLGLKRIRYVP